MASVPWGAESPWVGNTAGNRQPAGPFWPGTPGTEHPRSPAGRGHEAQGLPFSGKVTGSSSKGCRQFHLDTRLAGSGSPGPLFPRERLQGWSSLPRR